MNFFEKNKKESFDFLNLKEVDQKEADKIYQIFSDLQDSENKEVIISPDSKLAAKNWMLVYVNLKAKIDDLKSHKKQLEKRYLSPIDESIAKSEMAQSIIRMGIKQFLLDIDEKSVNFPDVGMFSLYNPCDKISYPDDESVVAEEIYKSGDEKKKKLIQIKYSFNKKVIKSEYKKNDVLPLDVLSIEKIDQTIRFRKAK